MDFKYIVSGDCIGGEQRGRQQENLRTTLLHPAGKRWKREGQREGGGVKIPEVTVSPLHANLQVANFQRCECACACPIR